MKIKGKSDVMKVTELIEKMGLSVETEGQDKEITGCYTGDLLSLAMSNVMAGNIWVTVQTNINTVAVATLTETACIILPQGLEPDENARMKADNEEVYILSSNKTAYELCAEIGRLI